VIDSASAGSGGTRLSQAMSAGMSTGPRRLRRTLPRPKLTGEPSVSTKAASGTSPPTVSAISARPDRATTAPSHCRAVGRSASSSAAKAMVNSACVCTTMAARPGGIPCAIPKNWKRNWPANSVRPTGTSADTGDEGGAPQEGHDHRQHEVSRAQGRSSSRGDPATLSS
jgi:hypothetical protein